MPVSLDAFQQIIDCHFGGPWLAIAIVTNSANSVEFDFVTEAGGTPGFIMSPPPRFFKTGPFQPAFPNLTAPNPPVTAKDITQKVTTNAGGAVVGWGVGATAFSVVESTLFIQCGEGIIPSQNKFTVGCRLGALGASLFAGFLAPKGKLAVGPYPNSYYFNGSPTSTIPILTEGSAPGTHDLIVDPAALTVTLLP